MKSSLFKGLDEQGVKDVSASFLSSKPYRDQIIKLLEEEIDGIRLQSVKSSSYDNPNWAYKQADAIGYERGLRKLISLLSEKI